MLTVVPPLARENRIGGSENTLGRKDLFPTVGDLVNLCQPKWSGVDLDKHPLGPFP